MPYSITDTSQIRINMAEDAQLGQFCGFSTFLGIYVYLDNQDNPEVGLDNNYAWINVLFDCPDTLG